MDEQPTQGIYGPTVTLRNVKNNRLHTKAFKSEQVLNLTCMFINITCLSQYQTGKLDNFYRSNKQTEKSLNQTNHLIDRFTKFEPAELKPTQTV